MLGHQIKKTNQLARLLEQECIGQKIAKQELFDYLGCELWLALEVVLVELLEKGLLGLFVAHLVEIVGDHLVIFKHFLPLDRFERRLDICGELRGIEEG
jgi:hypothetical protein